MSDAARELVDAVAARLADDGWTRDAAAGRPSTWAVLTRGFGDDFLAVLELQRLPVVRRRAYATARFGVGFVPAMDLAPVLALPVSAGVVFQLDPDRLSPSVSVRVDHVDAAASEIVTLARDAFAAAVARFRDADAFAAAVAGRLRRERQLATTTMLLHAATGRFDDASAALVTDDAAPDMVRRASARISRQLHRWDVAGRPTPPPFAVTVARLPPPPAPPAFAWSSVRANVRARRRARAAVARRAAGRTVGELGAMLLAENARRGTPLAPAVAFAEADRLARPGGRLRRIVTAWRDGRGVVVDLRAAAGRVRAGEPPPAWRARPATADYPAHTGVGHTLVRLTGSGRELLAAHVAAAAGPGVVLDAWLTASGAELRVHVGPEPVGVLDDGAAARFRPDVVAAADLYDEQVYAPGLAFTAGDGTVRLQLRQPDA